MTTRNRLGNVKNPYQGEDTKVLCVCSAGLLRSPTMVKVLYQRFSGYNARAVGYSKEYALIQLDEVQIAWADIIFCADGWTETNVLDFDASHNLLKNKVVLNFNIPDDYDYGSPELENIIEETIIKFQEQIVHEKSFSYGKR